MTIVVIKLILLCVSLYMVGFFASMEAAFSTVDKLALTHLAINNASNAKDALGLASTRERLLGTILMGTNFAVVLFTVLGTSLALEFKPFGAYTVPVTSVLIIILVNIFGELLPKTKAARAPLRYTLSGTRYLGVIHTLLSPLSFLLVEWPKRLLAKEEDVINEDTLRNIVEADETRDYIATDERAMIVGVLDSSHTPIREIMVPRVDVVALDLDDPIEENVRLAISSGYSRIPCYEGSIDNIVGILYVKDLFAKQVQGTEVIDLRNLIRPAHFVPSSKRASDMLRELRDKQTHIAIVVDEYGGTAGIITIEDLIEDIVGEIRDEYDKDEETVSISSRGNQFIIPGRTLIADLNEALDTTFKSDDAETVAGLLLEHLGRLPEVGDVVEFAEQGYSFVVDRVAKRSIVRVKATRLA